MRCRSIPELIRLIAKEMDNEGEVVKKFKAKPKNKPPRRKPSIQNESSKSDYMKNYMEEYRGDGKDYQKKPELIKELRKKQRERLKGKKLLKASGNVGIGSNTPVRELYITESSDILFID